MKILILTQYFPPEIGAPQNRLHGLAVRLFKRGQDVSVLTALPNYPEMKVHPEYRGKWSAYEEMNGLRIYRSYIYTSRRISLLKRMLSYFSFAISALQIGMTKVPPLDLIICESPPLTTGLVALFLKQRLGARLLFNVSDLWPESARQLGLVNNKFVLWLAYRLERYVYAHSEIITGQTRHIVENIRRRTGYPYVHWLPNGIDATLYEPFLSQADESDRKRQRETWRTNHGFPHDDFLILYAGILGYAQNLEVILEAADKLRKFPSIRFIVMGTGPRHDSLLQLRDELGVDTVHFLPPVPKKSMPEVLNAVDAGVVPLLDREVFRGAVPSKIYEILMMRKPLLLGVDGEANKLFIEETQCGLAYRPEDAHDLANKAKELYQNPQGAETYGSNGHELVSRDFTLDVISDRLWQIISENTATMNT